jgi:exopolyphosphatase/guanosine-5'-triphosphate,3'-diphosphate pyrophosphatase
LPLFEQHRVDPRQVGLVDIGSNSVRFVVYDAVARAPMLKFNEKAMCGLGRGLKLDGNLGGAEIAETMRALGRYFGLARAMGLEALDVFATEAVRAAANGPAFVAEIEQRFGVKVAVLTGEAEGRYAGLGVVSHFPDAQGIAGDLGGASLELCELHPGEGGDGEVGRAVTFPFGPLRKPEKLARKGDFRAVEPPIRAAFPEGAAGGDFYAVGGAWRAFAKLAMARLGHQFRIVEGYTLDAQTAREIAEDVGRRDTLKAEDLANVPKRRQEGLPAAALVLAGTLAGLEPARVVFSAGGVREGRLFARLEPADRRRDPLVEAARRYGNVESRFGGVGAELVNWTAPLFPGETERAQRLRIAACHLSDVAWSTHPDYRGEYALDRVLHLPLPGLDHAARGWLALAVYARYRGDLERPLAREALALAGEASARALVLGHALQLAYRLSGASAHLIAASRLQPEVDRIALVLPDDGSLPLGEAVERRLETLARALGLGGSAIVYADTNGGHARVLRAS